MQYIEECELQIQSILADIQKNYNILTIDDITGRIDECRLVISRLQLEKSQLQIDQQQALQGRIKQYRQDLKRFSQQLEFDKKLPQLSPGSNENNNVINYAQNLQRDNLRTLQSTVGILNDTHELAQKTTIVLQQQTEQIHRMHHSINSIDDELGRAKSAISRMMRRVASSKMVCVLIVIIVLFIILVLYFKLK